MNKLKSTQIKNCPVNTRLGDGGGLRYVHDSRGSRYWEMRYQVNGKSYALGLGGESTSLAQAREARDDVRALLRKGVNPAVSKRTDKIGTGTGLSNDSALQAAAEAYVASKGAEWNNDKHGDKWLRPMELHAAGLMKTPLSDININIVLHFLEPIWTTKTETAKRIQARLSVIFQWAQVREIFIGENPASWERLRHVLPAPGKIRTIQHFRSLPHEDLPSFWFYMSKSDAASTMCLRFLILTCARSGEARAAEWSEIDIKGKVWTIPGSKMKAGKEHRVPLSAPAMHILRTQQKLAEVLGGSNPLIFPSPNKGTVMSDVAIAKTVRRYGGDYTIHGFRSTFRDWCAESEDHDDLAAEISLAHMDKDKVRAAYLRSDLFDKRRKLMSDWGKFVTGGAK